MDQHFFVGVILGASLTVILVKLWSMAHRSRKPEVPAAGDGLERYPVAFSVMRISKTDQNLGQVTTGEHKARALAKMEKAKTPDDVIDLVEYRPHRRLPY